MKWRPNGSSLRVIGPANLISITLPEGLLPQNVVVSDLFPSSVTYSSATPSPSTSTPPLYQWNAPNPLRGYITIAGTANASLIGSTTFTNYASITTASTETSYANNGTSCTLHILGPDIWVEKTVIGTFTEALPGESITYQMRYGNNGPITANEVVLSDYLPNEIVGIQFSTPTSGSTGTLYYWNLGNLITGTNGTITIRGTISDTTLGSTTLTNVATITSTGGFYNLGSTTSSWSLHIPAPELYLYKFQPKEATFTLKSSSYADVNTVQGAVPQFADLDSDGDQDLIVDGANLSDMQFLQNNGSPGFASWTLITSNYATYTGTIIETAHDSHSFVDIDKDGDLDLFQGDGGGNYIEYYRNDGDWRMPEWTAQGNVATITGATELAPTFCDIDADGDQDLFVGKANGTIDFYENTGSSTLPIFSSAANNYAGVSGNTNAVPTFVDIEGDGDYDLLVGDANSGNIRLFRNIGTPKVPVWNAGVNYINFGVDQGHPTLADIDADGDSDLFIGVGNGTIFFYENTTEKTLDAGPNGTMTYYIRYGNNAGIAKNVVVQDLLPGSVTYISSSPAGTLTVNLLEWNIPTLGLRESGTISVTVSVGNLPDSSILTNIGTITADDCERYPANNTGTWSNYIISMDLSITKSIRNHPFTHITDNFEAIDVGDYSAPYLADLDGDDDDDLVVGASDKSIWFFRNDGGSFISMGSFSTGLGGRPHPCLIDENGYGTLSLFVGYDVGEGIGKIKIYKSDTPFTPSSWVSSGDFMSGENMDLKSAPTGVDIDGDGDEDLIVGNGKGAVWGYKNNGGGAWAWNWSFDMPNDDNYRVPSFFDLDWDTNLDLFCGIKNGTIEFYKNYGDQNSPIFYSAQKVDTFAGINVGNYASPAFGDVNGDKTQDLLIGRADGRLSLFRNEGSYGSEAVTGKKIAYILDCQKTGSLLVNGVVVEDLLPAGVGYDNYVIEPATMTSTFNQTENLLNWNFGNLGSSEYSWKITLIGSVTGAESNTPTNVATITPTSDGSLTNNYSSVTSHIIELVSDVWVSKRHLEWGTNSPPSEVPAGGYINYKIEYGNIGLLTAQGVKIVDTIPSGTTYLSSDKSCTVNIVGTLTYVKWDLESLPPLSGTRTINFKVQVGLEVATGTILLNIASITTGEADKSLENNLSTWTTIVKVPVIDLVIIKTGPATVTVGGDVLYVLTFWNAGTATLHNVKAYDYFGQSMNENNLTYQGLGSGAGSVSVVEAGYLLTLTIGTLTPDLSIVLEVKFKLSKNAIMGQSIINIASITYTGDAGIETQLENNYSSWITFIGTPSVALKIWILPMEGTGTSGYERRYSLILYNAGNVESGATITVTLPQDYLTYLSTGTTNVIQEKGSPATWVSPSAQYSTYTIGPYYDESSRKLWWIIDAQRESPDVYDTSPYVYATSTLIEKGEPSRYTLGHCYTKGTDTGWGGLGMPKTWDKLKNFLNGSTIALFPLYTFNTKVGSVSQATTITLTAEIEPMPMKTFDIMEISGGSHTLTDTITTMAIQSAGKSKSLGIQSTALTMRSTPHELYVGKGGFIFYQIESAVRPRLLLDTKDIDFRNSFPLNEPLMISTNTYLFWVKVAATETGTHIENIVGSEKTSHYLDSRPPAVDISSITQDCLINWKGTDPNLAPLAPQISGSGICRYTLYYKEGDSAWKPYGSYPSSSSSVTFAGKNGGRYEFYLEAVDIVGNRARSPINGLTISIMGTAADHLGDVIVWPNPYRADKHSQLNFGGCSDPIRNLTADAKIRVFNIKGELVKEKEVYPPSEGVLRWINPEREVASGVYIYVITNQAGEKHIGKLAIIK
ncbi:MAG: FG-GAP-like repeat-containing protein [bacterium]